MNAVTLRKVMIAITLLSVVGFVIYSYVEQDEPRQGGLINTLIQPEMDFRDATEYYPTGELKAEGLMNGKDKEGVWVYYHPNGDTLRIEQYFQGNLQQVLFGDSIQTN